MWFLLTSLACAPRVETPLPPVLAPPPPTPNCVHSQVEPSDETHHIEPLAYSGDPDAAWVRLNEIVGGMPRAERVALDDGYAHYVFTTALWRFRDDLQLVHAREEGVFHVRSASRVGRSDLGVNRRRVEAIRAALDGT